MLGSLRDPDIFLEILSSASLSSQGTQARAWIPFTFPHLFQVFITIKKKKEKKQPLYVCVLTTKQDK